VTVDNQIDPTTGTVRLRAEFANTDETLFPNQFVNVQLIAEQIQGATVVPTAAIQRSSTATYVYVVADQKTASVRQVETGPSERGLIVVSKGLVPAMSSWWTESTSCATAPRSKSSAAPPTLPAPLDPRRTRPPASGAPGAPGRRSTEPPGPPFP
jgi:multidrug efflux system membrane fusion protein